MLKTLIALAAMITLTVILVIVTYAPTDQLELKITLATAIIAVVASICSYAYGVEAGKESNRRDQEGN